MSGYRLAISVLVFWVGTNAWATSFFTRAYQSFYIDHDPYEIELYHRFRDHSTEADEEKEKVRLAQMRSDWKAQNENLRIRTAYDELYGGRYKQDGVFFYSTPPVRALPSILTREGLLSNQREILHSLFEAERRKFNVFESRRYLVPGRGNDDLLINDVYQNAPLHLHDDIILVYRVHRYPNSPFYLGHRSLVGILAFSSQGRLLTEKRLKIEFRRHPLRSLGRVTPRGIHHGIEHPLHWSEAVRGLQRTLRLRGGMVQVNSLLVDRTEKHRIFPFLYVFAYRNGLFSKGNVLRDESQTLYGDESYRGPLTTIPTHVVVEGYGAHTPLFSRMNLRPVTINGVIPGTETAEKHTSLTILGAGIEELFEGLADYSLRHSTFQVDMNRTSAGPIRMVPYWSPTAMGRVYMDIQQEDPFVVCAERMIRFTATKDYVFEEPGLEASVVGF